MNGIPARSYLRQTLVVLSCGLMLGGCEDTQTASAVPENAIRIGAVLPFSGPQSSTGIDLERALILAVEDVNHAGGVAGRPLHLTIRDSNSGSDRGRDELKDLIADGIDYLVGPQEYRLALAAVGEVKRYDILHILPSFTSPSITDSGSRGAWLRLAPSAPLMGCALATKAFEDGTRTTRTLAARDDYHLEMATVFNSALSKLGGRAYPTVTVASDESSYARAITQINKYDADATLMLAYPGTAATIIKEMARDAEVRWYFSPMLYDQALLSNLPEGVIEGSVGVSPSLSTDSDCETPGSQSGLGGAISEDSSVDCSAHAAERFAQYFAEKWHTNQPLKAAHYYYDAVIMLALALEQANADGLADPKPQELFPYLINEHEDDENIAWDSLDQGLEIAKNGQNLHFLGAAGEYEFDDRGHNIRAIVDTWIVNDQHQFADRKSVVCRIPNLDK